MTSESIDRFNQWRAGTPQMRERKKAFPAVCYSPFVSLMLDPKGYVRSCCHSWTQSIGNITEQGLGEIWHGEVNRAVRAKMRQNELPQGCATCQWDIEAGNFEETFVRVHDGYSVKVDQPEWPQSMWFMLSNACNLECVQCYGELSSSIRKNRDHLPPLRRVYDDAFFEELGSFLPHLQFAVFLGGESFLSRENFRIWDMMIDGGMAVQSHIVTNGTLFNERVKRVLSSLSCSVSISLDGATKETVESIRRNARFDELIANIPRFQEHCPVELSFCLMPQNHHEFADFLVLAEQLGCGAVANTVYHPEQFSLGALPKEELARIVADWEEQSPEVSSRLSRHRGLWLQEVVRMRRRLECTDQPQAPTYFVGISARMNAGLERAQGVANPKSARRALEVWSGHAGVDAAALDARDVVTCERDLAGLDRKTVDGRPLSELLMLLRERFGEDVEVTEERCGPDEMDRTMEFTNKLGEKTRLRWIALAPSDAASGQRDLLLAVEGGAPVES